MDHILSNNFNPNSRRGVGCNSSQDGRQDAALGSSQNQSSWGPGGAGTSEHRIQLPHFTNEEVEAQGSEVIGLKSQNQSLQGSPKAADDGDFMMPHPAEEATIDVEPPTESMSPSRTSQRMNGLQANQSSGCCSKPAWT